MRLVSCLLAVGLIVAPVPVSAESSRASAIAVLDLDASPEHSELAGLVADSLNAALHANKGFVVVERRKIASLLREQGLGQIGVVQEDTAAELGKLLGARQLVVGCLSRSDNAFQVHVRRVDVEKSAVLGTAQVRFSGRRSVDLAARELVAGLVDGEPAGLSRQHLNDAASEVVSAIRSRLPRLKAKVIRVDDLGRAVIDAGSTDGGFPGLKMVVYGTSFVTGSRERRGSFIIEQVESKSSRGPTRAETSPIEVGDVVEAQPASLLLNGSAVAKEAVTAAFRGLPHLRLVESGKSDLLGDVSVEGSIIGARRLILRIFDGEGALVGAFESSPSF